MRNLYCSPFSFDPPSSHRSSSVSASVMCSSKQLRANFASLMRALLGVVRADTCFCARNYRRKGRRDGKEGGMEGGDCPGCCPPRHTYKHPHSLPPSFPALLGGVITVPIIIHASQRCSHAGRDVDAHKQPKSPAHLGVASEHKGPFVLSCTLHFVFLPDPSCPGLPHSATL